MSRNASLVDTKDSLLKEVSDLLNSGGATGLTLIALISCDRVLREGSNPVAAIQLMKLCASKAVIPEGFVFPSAPVPQSDGAVFLIRRVVNFLSPPQPLEYTDVGTQTSKVADKSTQTSKVADKSTQTSLLCEFK